MTTDDEMKINYSVVLKQLRRELEGLDGRRQALMASIAAMSRLVDDDEEDQSMSNATLTFRTGDPSPSDVRLPVIPPQFFNGKSPTEAYRLLLAHWPGHYSPIQIADLFMQGGMAATTRTGLIQAIHSVLKRERARKAKEQEMIEARERAAAGVLRMPKPADR